MKKLVISSLFSIFIAAPVAAFDFDTSKLDVGAGYGFGNDGVFSIRGDYTIEDEVDKPVKVRIGYDRYSQDFSLSSNSSWTYNIFYAGAYYDFSKAFDLGDKIHPFAGLGYGLGSVSCSGCGGSSPTVGGLYYISGVQYDINEQFTAEASFSVWGGMSIGANYHFE